MKVGFVYDPIYLQHDTGQHVENAGRLEAIISHLNQTGLTGELVSIKPRVASVEELSLVHDRQHVSHIRDVAESGGGWLDMDTVMSARSYQTAVYAAGGAISATEAVITGEVDRAFALVRPPGHHATPQHAMGFCLFNNVAVATKYALAQYGLERVAIIDFDVHHGNGTQDIFDGSPEVLYISIHQYPHYPGTGSIGEVGRGVARGTKVNVPLPAGCGDKEYLLAFEQVIAPVTRRFEPQLIFVSAGYDSHWADQLAMMQVTTTGLARMVGIIKDLADELCRGRIVLSVEGGYHYQALASSVKATFDILLGKTDVDDPLGQQLQRKEAYNITPLLGELKEIHALS
ncbi:histone deacetylase [Chloroflexota bacterium]